MARYNTGIKVRNYKQSSNPNTFNSNKVFGRVVDVILDESHPSYDIYGGSQSINGVFYRNIELGEAEDKENVELSFAYQGNMSVKQTPIVGEIVQIESLPSEDRETFVNSKKPYWNNIIPVWNNPHYNAYFDEIQNYNEETEEVEPTEDENFIEKSNINSLQSFPGDTLIEGRHGQGIRFTGTKYSTNPWIDGSNNGEPLIIISNGHTPVEEFENITENVNNDKSSIYLTSNHTINLNQANLKNDSWLEKPIQADAYKGNQVIINSGRVFINAKDENIFLSSKNSIGINSQNLNIDSDEYISLDSKNILLGVQARKKEEPVILGNELEIFLRQLISEITAMSKAMTKAKTLDGKPILDLNFQGKISQVVLDSLNKQINPYGKSILKSKKVFTE